MQTQGKLESFTISFDIRSEYGHTSYVKFGGFDEFALENGMDSMSLFKTNGLSTWTFPLDRINNNIWQTAIASED